MNNVSALKSTKIESPKTPGGISKSLLTPCRRVGLSRNWKKAGPSPFISPLTAANSNVEVKVEKKPTRKRKERVEEENNDACESTLENAVENEVSKDADECDIPDTSVQKNDELVNTPSRHVALLRRKKSKVLLSEVKFKENDEKEQAEEIQVNVPLKSPLTEKDKAPNKLAVVPKDMVPNEQIQTPVRSKSKSKIKKKQSPIKSPLKSLKAENPNNSTENIGLCINKENAETNIKKPKSVSPKDLTKECMVVIQKKMFKIDKKNSQKPTESSKKNKETCVESQIVFDSSDEVPLSTLNKIDNITHQEDKSDNIIIIEDDNDFAETTKVAIKKLENKNTSTTGLKAKNKSKLKIKPSKLKTPITVNIEPKSLSQSSNSFDDDDDFFEDKKTILIRKTYDKVAKPLKAKSTGSITQKDIDDLRARIEVKKKLLLAKAVSNDTEELRSLIKKWQRGCQDALMELMDLMKAKCPEKQNMDYSEILETLKIPAVLVGYDSDNDCFNTPDDNSIILAKFNNL